MNSNRNKSRPLARSAYEAKSYSVWRRVLWAAMAGILVILFLVYVIAVLYSKYGSYTVTINKADANKYSLSLSETPDFLTRVSRLNAKAVTDITCIDGNTLPKDLDSINGVHNGDNYMAYTYYVKNIGEDILTIDYLLYIVNVTNDVDTAIRIRLYVDGEPTTYARTRADGSGPEYGTVEFVTLRTVVQKQVKDFKPQDSIKFTVVIWLEGNDPECLDPLIGGSMKSDMSISVVQAYNPETNKTTTESKRTDNLICKADVQTTVISDGKERWKRLLTY